MKIKYKVIFTSKSALAIAFLEINLWGQGKNVKSVKCGVDFSITTDSKDVLDVVSESIPEKYYRIERI